MAKIFYYDLETTGLKHWEHGIHQIAAIVEIDGKIVGKLNLRIRPYEKAKVDEKSLKIGGINKSKLKGFLSFKDGYKKVIEFLSKYVNKYDPKDKMYLCGYNINYFDNPFFRKFFIQNGDKYFNSYFWVDSIDVMVLASRVLKDKRKSMPNFRLETVAKQLGIDTSKVKFHDASHDVALTRLIYKKITK